VHKVDFTIADHYALQIRPIAKRLQFRYKVPRIHVKNMSLTWRYWLLRWQQKTFREPCRRPVCVQCHLLSLSRVFRLAVWLSS